MATKSVWRASNKFRLIRVYTWSQDFIESFIYNALRTKETNFFQSTIVLFIRFSHCLDYFRKFYFRLLINDN